MEVVVICWELSLEGQRVKMKGPKGELSLLLTEEVGAKLDKGTRSYRQNLVALGAFTKTGELRHTRYHLNIANEGRGS